MLAQLELDLTPVEKDEAVKYVDGFKVSDGKIIYDEFFGAFFASMLVENLSGSHADAKYNSLRQIFIITRHGALVLVILRYSSDMNEVLVSRSSPSLQTSHGRRRRPSGRPTVAS